MNKSNLYTVIDYGSSTTRLGVFNENLNNLFISFTEIIEKDNFEEHNKSVNNLIKTAEKKISNHIDNVTLLYDSPEIYSIDLSIRKDFDQKINVSEVYSSIMLEANQLIKNNYINKKIMHVISSKNIIDGKELQKNFDKNLKVKSIILEIKFICLPKEQFNKISNIFKKNNLQILNFFCSSYVKSLSYINSLNEYKIVSFLDIGYKRSTLLLFKNKKLISLNTIPIGGNHITNDISEVLKLNINDSEKIKKAFNKSESEFSYDQNINENNSFIKEILGRGISVDILKKVILARVEEIFELIFRDLSISNKYIETSNSILILTGNGSKLFDKNSFHLDERFSFKEISFYEENDIDICKSGISFKINLNHDEVKIVTKNQKKYGIFERFFNFFGR
tara:strand:+ start:7406 stop:8584 length:1179 start_codon:yes stop_codon:yes gene_type:complete